MQPPKGIGCHSFKDTFWCGEKKMISGQISTALFFHSTQVLSLLLFIRAYISNWNSTLKCPSFALWSQTLQWGQWVLYGPSNNRKLLLFRYLHTTEKPKLLRIAGLRWHSLSAGCCCHKSTASYEQYIAFFISHSIAAGQRGRYRIIQTGQPIYRINNIFTFWFTLRARYFDFNRH